MGAWHKLNLSIFKKVLSVGSGKLAQELNKKVELINNLESEVEKYSDEEIKNKFQELKTKITNENNSTQISEVTINEPIDLSIKKILIYPNQFDKSSMYIDVEILSTNEGEGEVQIALLNDKKLIASNPIKIIPKQQNYFQSFLSKSN